VRVLFVCTANICRSPSAQWLLREAVAAHPELAGVEVRSAGTRAVEGAPGCQVAPALAGHWAEHRSQALTPELIGWADLILTAGREHRAAVAGLDPAARTRTFTLRQAARFAHWLEDGAGGTAGPGDAAEGVPAAVGGVGEGPLAGTAARVAPEGIVALLDSARGLAPPPDDEANGHAGASRWSRRGRAGRRGGSVAADGGPAELHPDDVPDPHVLGTQWHAEAAERIAEAVAAVVALMRQSAAGGSPRVDGWA
jgi:protein-tyrosine phosphatase